MSLSEPACRFPSKLNMGFPKEVKQKTIAFILRETASGKREILLHSFASLPELPRRLPGGGVEEDETIEQAIHRELFEETGKDIWQLKRKLGVQSYFKPYINAQVVRHDFLFWSPINVPDSWVNRIKSSGGDAGSIFFFHWADSENLVNIDEEHRPFLTPDYLPELFDIGL